MLNDMPTHIAECYKATIKSSIRKKIDEHFMYAVDVTEARMQHLYSTLTNGEKDLILSNDFSTILLSGKTILDQVKDYILEKDIYEVLLD